jgi:uncharacterized protein YdhG (YjbR/CyaY superfamily)
MNKSGAKRPKSFSADELAAMRERALELRAEKNDEGALLAKVAEMHAADRAMAKRIHAIVKAAAPMLSPRTWYGMPAFANTDGKIVCFFQSGHKYKTPYSTFGFQPGANLDTGAMWPISFALKKVGAAEEAKIRALVKKAVRR